MRRSAALSFAVLFACPMAALADPAAREVYASCDVLMDPSGEVAVEAAGASKKAEDEPVDLHSVDVIAGQPARTS